MLKKHIKISTMNFTDKNANIFQLLFESSTEGVILCDKTGKIVLCNEQMSNMFRYTQNELIGEKVELLIPKNVKEKHIKHRAKYSEAPTKRRMGTGRDLRGICKDGCELPIEISLNHITLEDDAYVIALITDISERKLAELKIQELNTQLEEKVIERTKELKDSQQLHNLIARNFPNGTINVFDKDLNYIFVEGKELFKLGINSEKLVGSNYLDRLSPELAKQIKPKLDSVFEGESIEFDVKVKNQVYSLNAVPLYFKENEITQILVVEHNVTKVKNAEQKVKDSLNKEKELNELKSRFVSMASHEFRTPLSTILSSTSLVEKYDEIGNTEKKTKHLNKIKTSVKNLTAILNDILSISKLEEGITEIVSANFNVKNLINDIINESSGLKSEEQEIKTSHKGNDTVNNDEKIIKLIISNLLSNALKYSQKEVNINSLVEKNSLTISVTDKGIGIPKEEQKRLFERFFRAQNATNIQGTGLGLNIVKSYIDILNGKITINSATNMGTTITFTIPLNK
jgi:PAS domain S-box-containing protein